MNDYVPPSKPAIRNVGRSRRELLATTGALSIALIVFLGWIAVLGWLAAKLLAAAIS